MSAQKKENALGTTQGAMSALPEAGQSSAEVAGYIADMLLELRNMAKDRQLDFLAYLLEMSFQEAFDIAQKKDGEK